MRALFMAVGFAMACSGGAGQHAGTASPGEGAGSGSEGSGSAGSAAPVAFPAPSSPRTKEIEALVNKAAAAVESRGKAAFGDFRKRGSEWFYDDIYLFAYDIDLNVLLNPAFPEREGTNTHGQKDAEGKLFHDEFVKVVKERGAGWVDYKFPKPGTKVPSQKWSYVKGVTIDGTRAILGAGFYPE